MLMYLFLGYASGGVYTLQLLSDSIGLDLFITMVCLQNPEMPDYPYWVLMTALCVSVLIWWPQYLKKYHNGDYLP